LRQGESHAGWELSSVQPREVTFRKADRTEVLALKRQDGAAVLPTPRPHPDWSCRQRPAATRPLRHSPPLDTEERGVGRSLRLARGAVTRAAVEAWDRGYSVAPTSVMVPDGHDAYAFRTGCRNRPSGLQS
jgi:hypothetical protein